MKEITTERLVIRYFTPEDWTDLYDYLSDEKVVQYEPYDVFSLEQCKHESIKRSKNEAFLAVCLKNNKKVIGNIYFEKQDYDTWELGYVFNSTFQGMGYATESARAVLEEAFHELGARRIVAMCDPENEASWKLLERLHMRREGHLKKNIYFNKDEQDNPIWKDTFEYGILAEEWGKI